jgi:hypothetical protein
MDQKLEALHRENVALKTFITNTMREELKTALAGSPPGSGTCTYDDSAVVGAIAGVDSKVAGLVNDAVTAKQDLAAAKQEISEVKAALAAAREEIAELKQAISGLDPPVPTPGLKTWGTLTVNPHDPDWPRLEADYKKAHAKVPSIVLQYVYQKPSDAPSTLVEIEKLPKLVLFTLADDGTKKRADFVGQSEVFTKLRELAY